MKLSDLLEQHLTDDEAEDFRHLARYMGFNLIELLAVLVRREIGRCESKRIGNLQTERSRRRAVKERRDELRERRKRKRSRVERLGFERGLDAEQQAPNKNE